MIPYNEGSFLANLAICYGALFITIRPFKATGCYTGQQQPGLRQQGPLKFVRTELGNLELAVLSAAELSKISIGRPLVTNTCQYSLGSAIQHSQDGFFQ